jgi:UDP-N-acetylmuramoylalanine--D-glutamate ligase
MDLEKKKVTVVGLGRSGEAAAVLLAEQGARVRVVDDERKPIPSSLTAPKYDIPIQFELGSWRKEALMEAEFVVVSPGVPLSSLPMQELARAEIPVISELELASRLITAPIIAITGTNGKSTTTTLVAEILKEDHRKIFLGGNIGTPLSLSVLRPFDFIVVEVSSFQLETIESFRPKIAALLNVTEDHLNRHGTLDHYRAMKERIFKNQTRVDYAVFNASDSLFNRSAQKSVPIGFGGAPSERGVYLSGDTIFSNIMGVECPIVWLNVLKLSGAHNIENVMAAITISLLAGASHEAIWRTLTRFTGLPHRMETVREWHGVTYIDDSKGTNVGAVMKSLEGMDHPVILIAGGLDKGSDFAPLKELVLRKVKRLILMGDAVLKLARCFSDHPAIERVYSMKEAVLMAASSAAPGDVVLLSPGCASFDMFRNYEHRGDCFKEAVLELTA